MIKRIIIIVIFVIIKVPSQKINENTVLQPVDSKKPLALSKEEIGRHTWYI